MSVVLLLFWRPKVEVGGERSEEKGQRLAVEAKGDGRRSKEKGRRREVEGQRGKVEGGNGVRVKNKKKKKKRNTAGHL